MSRPKKQGVNKFLCRQLDNKIDSELNVIVNSVAWVFFLLAVFNFSIFPQPKSECFEIPCKKSGIGTKWQILIEIYIDEIRFVKLEKRHK